MKRLVVFILLVAILTACAQPPAATPAQPQKPTLLTDKLGEAKDLVPTDAEVATAKSTLGTGKIGIIPCTMGSEYHSTVTNSAVARAKELGITAEISDPQAKAEAQISAIENFVSAGAKVIMICVLDPAVVKPALQAAVDQGVYQRSRGR